MKVELRNMANEDSDCDSNDHYVSDLECDCEAVSSVNGIKDVTCHSDTWNTVISSKHGGLYQMNVDLVTCKQLQDDIIVGCNVFLGTHNNFNSVTISSSNSINGKSGVREVHREKNRGFTEKPRARSSSHDRNVHSLNGQYAGRFGDVENSNKINVHERDSKIRNEGCYWETILKADNEGDNLIFIAIISHNVDLCYNMLSLIPRQNLIQTRSNNMLQTALHLAALIENSKLVRRFLVAGVQVDKQDIFGNTAVHIACKRKNLTVAKTLLTPVSFNETRENTYEIPVSFQPVPQNLEIRNYDGDTCFMIAAHNGHFAMMDLLISKKANINVRDIKSGMTVLHSYTESARVEEIKYLLQQSDLDVNAKTYSGLSSLEIANIRGHSYIAYLLLCAGAKPKMRPKDCLDFLAESDSDEESLF